MYTEMFAEVLMRLIRLFSRRKRQQSEPDISPELREQTINIIDDLVNAIAPGYLSPDPLLDHFDYKKEIYRRVYKYLWDELGIRRFEYVNCRDEIFDLLRYVPSENFFNVIEYLLKEVYRIVHIQITIPDNFALNPYSGEELWSRKESVRDRHISRFKGAVNFLNHRLFQHNAKYRYDLSGEFVQMVRLDTGLDVPNEDSGIEKKGDDQPPEHQKNNNNQSSEHHQNQNRSEFWNKKGHKTAIVGLIFIILTFIFGDGILRPLLRWMWNYLQTSL